MARAPRPARPSDDLEARRDGPVLAGGMLAPELADFCQSGLSVVFATRGPDGWPIPGRASGCRIEADGAVRLVAQRGKCLPALEAIAAGAGVAATFSRPSDHRSIQLKARRATVAPALSADVAAAERQAAGFREMLAAVGHPEVFTGPYTALGDEMVVVAFRPEAAFVQTPGPKAGSALR